MTRPSYPLAKPETGPLPPGLELTRRGRIEGTPSRTGHYTFRVFIRLSEDTEISDSDSQN